MNTILNTFSRKQYYIFALRLGLKVIQIKGEDQKTTRNLWGGVVVESRQRAELQQWSIRLCLPSIIDGCCSWSIRRLNCRKTAASVNEIIFSWLFYQVLCELNTTHAHRSCLSSRLSTYSIKPKCEQSCGHSKQLDNCSVFGLKLIQQLF